MSTRWRLSDLPFIHQQTNFHSIELDTQKEREKERDSTKMNCSQRPKNMWRKDNNNAKITLVTEDENAKIINLNA